MKARVSYDPDKVMWVIEIKTNDTEWDVSRMFKVKDTGVMHGWICDAILDEFVKLQRNGWDITFSDDYPMYKGGRE